MKLTKVFLGLVWGSVLFAKKVEAVTLSPINKINPNIKLILPTATPTLLPIKVIKPILKVSIMPIVTAKLTPALTSTPILTVTPTEEIAPTITTTLTAIVEPSVTLAPMKTTSNDDLSKWFLIITAGLLTLIIVVQAWPSKDEPPDQTT